MPNEKLTVFKHIFTVSIYEAHLTYLYVVGCRPSKRWIACQNQSPRSR
jgi:hypothetical protein